MKLAEKVKKFAGLSDTEMYKRLGMESLPAYQWFEARTNTLSVERCMLLEQVYLEHGGTREDFEELRRKFGKSIKKKKKKK